MLKFTSAPVLAGSSSGSWNHPPAKVHCRKAWPKTKFGCVGAATSSAMGAQINLQECPEDRLSHVHACTGFKEELAQLGVHEGNEFSFSLLRQAGPAPQLHSEDLCKVDTCGCILAHFLFLQNLQISFLAAFAKHSGHPGAYCWHMLKMS